MRKHMLAGTCVAVVAAGLAGCGGDQTSAAATCLRNAIANQAIGSGNNNCADDTAYNVAESGSGTKFSVTCTHQAANQYVCDVSGPGAQSVDSGGMGMIQGGFYNVTYDGKSIVFQPTQ